MSREWCDDIISIADHKIEKAQQGLDLDGKESADIDGCSFRCNDKRIDTSIVMDQHGSLMERQTELACKLRDCLEEMQQYYLGFCLARPPALHWCEEICCKIQRTPPGGGFTDWHYEQGSGEGEIARRWGVWMLYLNDVTKGGKTDFPVQGLSVEPTAGTMVIWPATYTHPHRSAPDLQQYKYIITGWLQYWIDGESKKPREERYRKL